MTNFIVEWTDDVKPVHYHDCPNVKNAIIKDDPDYGDFFVIQGTTITDAIASDSTELDKNVDEKGRAWYRIAPCCQR